MAWYSILPTHLTTYETWIIRGFLVLALINILPWILAIVYDFVLYLGRVVWHEIPVFGGRARGENRPRAPSLRARARARTTAATRRLSFVDIVTGAARGRSGEGEDEGGEGEESGGEGRKRVGIDTGDGTGDGTDDGAGTRNGTGTGTGIGMEQRQ